MNLSLNTISLALLLTAGLLVTPAAQAQSKKALAAKVAQLHQPAAEGLARSLARETTQRIGAAAAQAMGAVPPEKREALSKEIQAELKAFNTDAEARLKESATKVGPPTLTAFLEENFSEDELKQVAAWLESPVSKKYQEQLGGMQSALQRKLVEDTKQSVDGKIKALEASLQKKFAPYLPPPSAASGAASSPAKPKAK